MREAHPIEQAVGMDYYVSDAEGTGWPPARSPEDFRVTELEAFDVQPVDADTGGYQHLVLRATLRGWDTNDFAGRLSDGLGISRERVSWAGTKDKRAVTTQLFSVDGVEPADLPEIADADVEVVSRAGRPVLFGDLAGNDFEIAVRDVDRPESVAQVTDDLREFAGVATRGDDDGGAPSEETTVAVPNYFGPATVRQPAAGHPRGGSRYRPRGLGGRRAGLRGETPRARTRGDAGGPNLR